MAAPRAHVRETIVSKNALGQLVPVSGASVAVYSTGTTTPITQTIYSSSGGGATLTNPVTSDSNGLVEFWIPIEQTVDLAVTSTGFPATTVTAEALVSTGSGVRNTSTTAALTNNGDLLMTAGTLTFQDNAGTTHTVAALNTGQTFTGMDTFTGGAAFTTLPVTISTAYLTTLAGGSSFTGLETLSGGVVVNTLPLTVGTAYLTTVASGTALTGLDTFSGGVAISTLPLTVTSVAYLTTVASGTAMTGLDTFSGGVAITTLPVTISSAISASGGLSIGTGTFTDTGSAVFSGGVTISTVPVTVTSLASLSGGLSVGTGTFTDTGSAIFSGGVTVSTLPITVSSLASMSGGVTISQLPLTVNSSAYLTTIQVTGGSLRWTGVGGANGIRMNATGNVASGSIAQISDNAAPNGFIFVKDTNQGQFAMAWLEGGGHGTTIMIDPSSKFSNTVSTNAKNNIYWSAANSRYEVENRNQGGTTNYVVWVFSDS